MPAHVGLGPFPTDLQRALEGKGTLLIHGCGLVREGRGYLFLAPSGGGKSTLARMSAGEADCLSDEHLLLSTDGGIRIAAPPCCPSEQHPRGAPLVAASVLAKGPSLDFQPMTPATLLSFLTGQIYASGWEPAHAARILAAARRAADAVPAFRMGFSLSSRPWKRIPTLA